MFSEIIHPFHYLKAKQLSAILWSTRKSRFLTLWIVLKSKFSNLSMLFYTSMQRFCKFKAKRLKIIFTLEFTFKYICKIDFRLYGLFWRQVFFQFFDMMFSSLIHTFHYLKAKRLSAIFTSNPLMIWTISSQMTRNVTKTFWD